MGKKAKSRQLSNQEIALIRLKILGFTTREIADFMHYSPSEIEKRFSRSDDERSLYRKIGVRNEKELMIWGLANRIVDFQSLITQVDEKKKRLAQEETATLDRGWVDEISASENSKPPKSRMVGERTQFGIPSFQIYVGFRSPEYIDLSEKGLKLPARLKRMYQIYRSLTWGLRDFGVDPIKLEFEYEIGEFFEMNIRPDLDFAEEVRKAIGERGSD